MKVFKTHTDLRQYLDIVGKAGQILGFAPTMGALHAGHMALIDHLKECCDVVVCSIFVNPTQFNNVKDLETYPRTLDADLEMLEAAGCDVVFAPSQVEMYPTEETWYLDLGELDQILEGAHRPGHFQGVTQVVKKLFDAVQPDVACFGQKDYQQVMVVQRMIDIFKMPISLHVVPTARDAHGLAMSSRNRRLSEKGRLLASRIFMILNQVSVDIQKYGPERAVVLGMEQMGTIPEFKVEYLEVRAQGTLDTVAYWDETLKVVILTAVWVEGVRLIDNLLVH